MKIDLNYKKLNESIRICMICTTFPPEYGGAATQAIALAEELKTMGFKIEFLVNNGLQKSKNDIYKDLKVYRSKTYFPKKSKLSEFIFLFQIFAHCLLNKDIRIVHFHSIRGFEAFIFPFLKIAGKKIIFKMTLAGSDDPLAFRNRKRLSFFYMLGLRYVDRFVAISSSLHNLALQGGILQEKLISIHNGVDTKRFKKLLLSEKIELKQKLKLAKYNTILFTVGQIEERKRLDFLLSAWVHIRKSLENSVFLIAGPINEDYKDYYGSLIKFINQNNLNDVIFLNEISNVDDYMKVSDCFVFSSRAEGLVNVLIEALSTQVPVVSTYLKGITDDIIEEGDLGRICYSDSPEQYAQIVVKVLVGEHDDQKLEADCNKIRNKFDIRSIAQEYSFLYHKLIDRSFNIQTSKVLMVLKVFPPNYAGATIQGIYLSKKLREKGLRVEFVTENFNQSSAIVDFEGFRTYKLKTYFSSDKFIQIRYFIFGIKIFFITLFDPQIEIVFFHSIGGTEIFISPLLRLIRKRSIVELTLVGSDDPLTLKSRRAGRLFLKALNMMDKIIAISTRLNELSLKAGIRKEKLEIIPVGVDTTKFYLIPENKKLELREKLGLKVNSRIFLAVGQVEERKDYKFMLRAWKFIQDEMPESMLLIAGPFLNEKDDYYLNLQNMVESGSLRVKFLGLVPNIYDYMKIADCLVHCSLLEGLPNVLVEASVTGLPIVCRLIEGITSDIITSPYIGRECPTDDPKDFADNAIKILSERNLLKTEEQILLLKKKFDIEEVASRYVHLFENFL